MEDSGQKPLQEGHFRDATLEQPNKSSPKIDEKNVSSEVKETLDMLLKLKKSYYKIPSLSAQQKENMQLGEIIDGRKKVQQDFVMDNKPGSIILLRKVIPGKKNDAIVREYVEGVPEEIKGYQMFTSSAAYNLGLENVLPSERAFSKIAGKLSKKYSEPTGKKLAGEFIQGNKLAKVGYFNAKYCCPVYVNDFRYVLLLKGGKCVEIDDYGYIDIFPIIDPRHGYPIMIREK